MYDMLEANFFVTVLQYCALFIYRRKSAIIVCRFCHSSRQHNFVLSKPKNSVCIPTSASLSPCQHL